VKVRYGFISNSSTTCFVVKFDKMPSSFEELCSMLNSESKDFSTTSKLVWEQIQHIMNTHKNMDNYWKHLKLSAIGYLFDYFEYKEPQARGLDSFNLKEKFELYRLTHKESTEQLLNNSLDDIIENILHDVHITKGCILIPHSIHTTIIFKDIFGKYYIR
jgi:hypothetical protein